MLGKNDHAQLDLRLGDSVSDGLDEFSFHMVRSGSRASNGLWCRLSESLSFTASLVSVGKFQTSAVLLKDFFFKGKHLALNSHEGRAGGWTMLNGRRSQVHLQHFCKGLLHSEVGALAQQGRRSERFWGSRAGLVLFSVPRLFKKLFFTHFSTPNGQLKASK